MSNDPNQPNQPYYPPSSPYESSPYGQQGQPNYPPPPPPPSEDSTQLAYPPSDDSTYITPPATQSTQSAYPPPPYETVSANQATPSTYPPPSYGVPSYTQPPARKSRRLLWIILGSVGLLVVLIVAGIIGLVALINHNPGTDVVNGYYTAIKNQNYSQAYSYLAPNLTLNSSQTTLTQDVFVQGLQGVDGQKGKVSNYTITSTSLNSNNGTSSGTYIVSVTRNGAPYNVHLNLQQDSNGQWKIISFDTV
jgi:hypothetical protein